MSSRKDGHSGRRWVRSSGGWSAAVAGEAQVKSASATAVTLVGVPESVSVTCPDNLVIVDLPKAKSLGAFTKSAAAATLGECAHICYRCEFPGLSSSEAKDVAIARMCSYLTPSATPNEIPWEFD